MKKINLFILIGLIIIVFSSCGSETPYSGRHVVSITPTVPSGRLMEPPCCVVIDCDPPAPGCQGAVDTWGALCGDFGVCVMRSSVDTLYDYYSRNDMENYHSRYNIIEVFPDINRISTGVRDSLLNGSYKVHVTADSSIVVVKNPTDSVGFSNIIWAFDREASNSDQ